MEIRLEVTGVSVDDSKRSYRLVLDGVIIGNISSSTTKFDQLVDIFNRGIESLNKETIHTIHIIH